MENLDITVNELICQECEKVIDIKNCIIDRVDHFEDYFCNHSCFIKFLENLAKESGRTGILAYIEN